jgi:phosphatidyl-myo-inositol dimannoside synthase
MGLVVQTKMSTRRALLISGSYYPPQIGGISRQLYRVANSLGPDSVCVLTGNRADASTKAENGVRVYRVPSLFHPSRISRATAWVPTLARIMAKDRPDLVLLGSVDDSNLGLWLHKVLKLPIVLFAYGNEVLSAIEGKHEQPKRAFLVANQVVVCSSYSAKLTKDAGTSHDRIHVLHPACDTTFFRPVEVSRELRQRVLTEDSANKKVILSVGNLVSRKGHDIVIRALKLLETRVPNLCYVIVGNGPERSNLEQLAREVGVAHLVKFVGNISDEELPQFYSLCDVFVMASRAQESQHDVEGFGIVYLEANACNKPVIGGRSGGVAEAVIDGVSGLLVDPQSEEDVAEKLAHLLLDTEFARRLGQQGYERVQRDFGWDGYCDKLLTIMKHARSEGALKV